MIILGIDPSLTCSGYAVLVQKRTLRLNEYGTIKTSTKHSIPQRLSTIYDDLSHTIHKYGVTHIGIETPFLGKSPTSYLKLGYVRSVVYLLAAQRSLQIREFPPRTVKKAVTSWGAAPKDQVARVIHRLFPQLKTPVKHDITDAIAVGLTTAWKE